MRTIERTGQFKHDYKREIKGQYRKILESNLVSVIKALANDEPLPEKCRDHALTGNWKDCHVKPDLVMIYSKLNEHVLQLVRLGSHSELGR